MATSAKVQTARPEGRLPQTVTSALDALPDEAAIGVLANHIETKGLADLDSQRILRAYASRTDLALMVTRLRHGAESGAATASSHLASEFEEKVVFFRLKDARKAANQGNASQLLNSSEKLYDAGLVTPELAKKLVELALRFEDTPASLQAMALYLDAYGLENPVSQHVISRLRTKGASAFDTAVAYLRNRAARKITSADELSRLPTPKGTPPTDALIFIIPGPRPAEIVARLKPHLASSAAIIFPNSNLELETINSPNITFEAKHQIRSIQKVDFAADPEIFSCADALASSLLDALTQHVKAPAIATFLREFVDGLTIVFRDLISPFVREEWFFHSTIAEVQPREVVVMGERAFAASLSAGLGPGIKVRHLGETESGELSVSPSWVAKELRRFLASKEPNPPHPTYGAPIHPWTLPDQDLIVVANLTDRQTWGNLLPLLPRLTEGRSVLFFPAPATLAFARKKVPGFSGSVVEEIFSKPNITVAVPGTGQSLSRELVDGVEAAVTALIEKCWTVPASSIRGLYALCRAKQAIRPTIQNALEIAATWDEAVRHSRAVLVCPGRHLQSLMLVLLARRYGIPSYEVQNGTISATGRFVRPLADKVFSIDAFSSEVYEEFLGLEHGRVVESGSPRIDHSLEPLRLISKSAARLVAFAERVPEEARILLFATQPLALECMRRIATIVFEGAKEVDDIYLALRMHPTEGASHKHAYWDLLKSVNFPKQRLLQGKGKYEELQACDIVCTFYSTIGVEALALGKQVICVAPDRSPLPYDICMLGAEGPVTTAGRLRRLLALQSTRQFAAGQAVNIIIDQIFGRRSQRR